MVYRSFILELQLEYCILKQTLCPNYWENAYKNFTEKIMTESKTLRKRYIYMEKRCHMIGPYHSQAKLGRGVGEAFILFA